MKTKRRLARENMRLRKQASLMDGIVERIVAAIDSETDLYFAQHADHQNAEKVRGDYFVAAMAIAALRARLEPVLHAACSTVVRCETSSEAPK